MRIFLNHIYLRFLVVCLLASSPVKADIGAPDSAFLHSSGKSGLSAELLTTFLRVAGPEPALAADESLDELNDLVAHLQSKRAKYRSERRFLSYLFYKVHRHYLKRYRSHTTLYELLSQGNYDCVTGSALYALLFDALGISYQIHEFPYHVYLTVTTADQATIMIESTDPQYGFVTDAKEQAARYQHYRQRKEEEAYYHYDFTIQETINLLELAGLSYFNEAVEHYNKQELQPARRLLQQARCLYASPRTEAFSTLINSVSQR